MADREQKDSVANPLRTPYYVGDPFCCEKFIESARAFLEQAETRELAFQRIREQTKVERGQGKLWREIQT